MNLLFILLFLLLFFFTPLLNSLVLHMINIHFLHFVDCVVVVVAVCKDGQQQQQQ